MIELIEGEDDYTVLIAGKEFDLLDAGEDYVLVECELDELNHVTTPSFPEKLTIQIQSSEGFGTYFFQELRLTGDIGGIHLDFVCHTPNKYWEGRFGLAAFLKAMSGQVRHYENLKVESLETEDDWKGITIRRTMALGEPILPAINGAAQDLGKLLKTAEIALGGLEWKIEYETDEELYCKEVLLPLLRRMGFLFVRYTHGRREYGKDFTFPEFTPFGNHRHYGLQAKAGNISGGVNSQIDELIGQLEDAFSMPYLELGMQDQWYISTFIIAISGVFTENAREKIASKVPKGLFGSVLFLDRHRIMELVERYWHAE